MATILPPANFESIEECQSFKGKYDIQEYFDYDTNTPCEDKIRQSLMTKTVGSLDCEKSEEEKKRERESRKEMLEQGYSKS